MWVRLGSDAFLPGSFLHEGDGARYGMDKPGKQC